MQTSILCHRLVAIEPVYERNLPRIGTSIKEQRADRTANKNLDG
jgi:hypothetical protein